MQAKRYSLSINKVFNCIYICEIFPDLSLDCGRIQQEGDLLHGFSITADLPRDIITSNYQVVSSWGIGVGDVDRGRTL